MRSTGFSVAVTFLALVVVTLGGGVPQDTSSVPPLVVLTTAQDHQRTMDLLQITSLRRGADGRNADAPNAANYDESKANPYPKLPDPLLFKNGKRVTTARMWWN